MKRGITGDHLEKLITEAMLASVKGHSFHTIQRFTGAPTGETGMVVCFVTCKDEITEEMQQAINQAVIGVFREHGCDSVPVGSMPPPKTQ